MLNSVKRMWMAGILVSVLALPAFAGERRGEANDQKIQQQVNKVLNDNKAWKDVQARVDDGVVTLKGEVPLYRDKQKLEQKIAKRKGVAGVRDEVEIAGTSASDLQLQETLANKLRYDREGFGSVFNNLTIGVDDGVATVGGTVRTPVDKDSALGLVSSTPGVREVVDNVRVAPTSFYDDQLRLQVARAIYRRLPPQYALDPQMPIRIVVVNGHVELDGVVNSKLDRQIAEMQAQSVPGVFSVTDNLAIPREMER
ncbi:MAG TPA: BON domain-containing protein [Terriglobales bacterium]|nr:BON domain-containing protein [Terriglobales bacterium]